jgi:hypothetical protein
MVIEELSQGIKGGGERHVFGEIPQEHASEAEAHANSIGLLPGITPRPTARMGFSAP